MKNVVILHCFVLWSVFDLKIKKERYLGLVLETVFTNVLPRKFWIESFFSILWDSCILSESAQYLSAEIRISPLMITDSALMSSSAACFHN